jgi:hypothetical protein
MRKPLNPFAAILLGLGFLGYSFWGILSLVTTNLGYTSLEKPYEAQITGYDDSIGTRRSNHRPMVEIRFANGTITKFNSQHTGGHERLPVGKSVRILHKPKQKKNGDEVLYEIDDTFHRYGDLVLMLATFAMAVFSLKHGVSRWQRLKAR